MRKLRLVTKVTARILLGVFLFFASWFGATFLGMTFIGDSDAVIIPAVIGCFVGVQLCLTAWTNSWKMWSR